MEEEYSIVAENISKCYKMYSGPKEKLLDLILPKGAGKNFFALKDLSFNVKKGDIVGLIGLNGAGKSTLSNILGGVSMPTEGKIKIDGEASLIAIGIGLNNFLTGIENIEVKSLMMGYKSSEIEKIKQEVIEFADLGDFINQPIRTYSSGMRARLGFAISVNTNPDILVIDEALSVGDPTFTRKCLDKMNEFKESGKTIFFVSHSIGQVKEFCNKAMWLEYGVLKEYGDVEEVISKYNHYIKIMSTMTEHEKKFYKTMIIENQEHSLLKEFKFIDPKFKKIYPHGKLIKFVTLVNKDIKTEVVTYNFDVQTLLLGFMPSLIRERFGIAIAILLCQILVFFLVSFPFSIGINFLVTATWALFTGRKQVEYLIKNKSYLGYEVWKEHVVDSDKRKIDCKRIENEVISEIKSKKIIMIVSLISVIIISIIAIINFKYRY